MLLMTNLLASELTILPLKKPILDKSLKAKKIIDDVIKPKPKPRKDKIKEKTIEKKIVEKKEKKIGILLPKSKPLIVKKENIKLQKSSKYYRQKDFNLVKKRCPQNLGKGKPPPFGQCRIEKFFSFGCLP